MCSWFVSCIFCLHLSIFSWSLYLSSSRDASPPTISTPGRAITLLQDLKAGRFRLKLALNSAYLPLSAEDTPTLKSVAEASSAPLDLKVSLYWEKCDFHTEQGLKGLERRCPSQPWGCLGWGRAGEDTGVREKGYILPPFFNWQMAPFQTNKELISTGIKEFNVLLNQQVSQGTVWKDRWRECVLGGGGARRFIWNCKGNGGIGPNV